MDGISQNKNLPKVLLSYFGWYSHLSGDTVMGTVAFSSRKMRENH